MRAVFYNYDNAMMILDLLMNNEIAKLEFSECTGDLVIQYLMTKDLPNSVQEKVKVVLANSLPQRLFLIKNWNDYIISVAAGKDVSFTFVFNAVYTDELEFEYSKCGTFLTTNDQGSEYDQLRKALETVESLMTNMGIHRQQLINVYRRDNVGRQRKYAPITLGEVVEYVRKALKG